LVVVGIILHMWGHDTKVLITHAKAKRSGAASSAITGLKQALAIEFCNPVRASLKKL
jgi:hypothetical protein